MEKKMEPIEKLQKIKDEFEDFSVQVVYIMMKAKKVDNVLAESLKGNLEEAIGIILTLNYETPDKKKCEKMLSDLSNNFETFKVLSNIAVQSKYIPKKDHKNLVESVEKFENLIQE